jgi:predicted metal-dependent hydrolase
VGADGLAVSAPKWVPLHEVDKAVLEKSGWIVKKLQETRARHERLESARIDWKNGATLPFLGEQLQVVIDSRHAFAGVGAALGAQVVEPPGAQRALQVALPLSATPEQIRDAVQAWLMRQARQIFTERLMHFSPQMGVQWRKLSLSSAGTRWGSASADGSIRLNWRLVHFKQSVIDYVVVHELSHLRVMDHSPRFWDTVRAVVPDYADLRGQLKDDAIPRW